MGNQAGQTLNLAGWYPACPAACPGRPGVAAAGQPPAAWLVSVTPECAQV
jgi:hypothetical protein